MGDITKVLNPFSLGKSFKKTPDTPAPAAPEPEEKSTVDPNLDKGIETARRARVQLKKKSGRAGLRVDLNSQQAAGTGVAVPR